MLRIAEHASLTDVGRAREHNEDSYLVRPPLFVVADGMAGANAGEVASGIVIETMAKEFGDGDMPGALGAAIEEANSRIHSMAQENRDLAGMGTTTTAGW